ncbi:MAG: TolC family protein, partial [Bacteroidales bacterium]
MKRTHLKYILSFPFLVLSFMINAQTELTLTYTQYMDTIRERNLVYAAEKLNLPIAEANVRSAKIFNDPSLSVEYANNNDAKMLMGQSISGELSKTFSFGKRTASIDLAKSEKALSMALLDDFFRNLQADATITYCNALKFMQLYEVKLSSFNSINQLALADSIKFALGKIMEVDAFQSRLEAGIAYNELLQAWDDLYNSCMALNILLGKFSVDTIYFPQGNLGEIKRTFSQTELLSIALDKRTDLVAAKYNIEIAQKAKTLAQRERGLEFDLALGYNYNTEVRNELAPAPQFSGLTLGLSIPLKFSSANKGIVETAKLKINQAEAYFKQAQIQVQTEVIQRYNTYTSLSFQLERYNTGMLEKAKAVIEGKIYSYNRGETSLLEVLNAQRTYNDISMLY